MNFLLTIIYGYILVALILIFLIWRDTRRPRLFFWRHKRLAIFCVAVLFLGILTGIYSTLIEPNILRTNYVTVQAKNISTKLKIAFVTDLQVGKFKKSGWMEKIVERIDRVKPDLVILGGDLIDNEGTFEDESQYLEPLKKLVGRYPIYYVLGNHEYGIGGAVRARPEKYTGDRSQLLIDRMNSYNISLLRNSFECLKINDQNICLFGTDDIWKKTINYTELKKWNRTIPLILVTHNPDGILYYPTNLPAPILTLAGHTHGGQIWLPIIGPLATAQTILDASYYRGLNFFKNMPIFTSVGAGESGAPLRLFAVPEVVIIELQP
jgi:hypothetical protein